MKKLIYPIAIICVLGLSSCKKDRTCTCTATSTVTQTSGGVTSTTSSSDASVKTIQKSTKSEARVNCMSIKYTFGPITSGSGSASFSYKEDYVSTCSLN